MGCDGEGENWSTRPGVSVISSGEQKHGCDAALYTPVLKDTAQCVDLIRLGDNLQERGGLPTALVGETDSKPRTIFRPLKKTSLSKRQANKKSFT
ncbi:hypothetical protein RB195_007871 [Necator americanus]|uniref:Uncharacterized protein n=1 Tax=Necator americanus TaxID=51031 RepID=A0ABR1C1X7_NECAM